MKYHEYFDLTGWKGKYKKGGLLSRLQQGGTKEEVPTKYIAPKLPPLDSQWLNVMDMKTKQDNMQVQPSQPKRPLINKIGDIVRNPMTAIQFYNDYGNLPDYFNRMADRNKYDAAIDVLNPMTYLDAAKRTATLEHFRDSTQNLPNKFINTLMDVGAIKGVSNEFQNSFFPKPLEGKFATPSHVNQYGAQFYRDKPYFSEFDENGNPVVNEYTHGSIFGDQPFNSDGTPNKLYGTPKSRKLSQTEIEQIKKAKFSTEDQKTLNNIKDRINTAKNDLKQFDEIDSKQYEPFQRGERVLKPEHQWKQQFQKPIFEEGEYVGDNTLPEHKLFNDDFIDKPSQGGIKNNSTYTSKSGKTYSVNADHLPSDYSLDPHTWVHDQIARDLQDAQLELFAKGFDFHNPNHPTNPLQYLTTQTDKRDDQIQPSDTTTVSDTIPFPVQQPTTAQSIKKLKQNNSKKSEPSKQQYLPTPIDSPKIDWSKIQFEHIDSKGNSVYKSPIIRQDSIDKVIPVDWMRRVELPKKQLGGTLPTPYLKQPSRDDQSTHSITSLKIIDMGWLDKYSTKNTQSKMQQGGQLPPIITHDPNDPRLRSYNDSLNLYNYTKLQESLEGIEPGTRIPFLNNNPREDWRKADSKEDLERYNNFVNLIRNNHNRLGADSTSVLEGDRKDQILQKVGNALINKDKNYYWNNAESSPDLAHRKILPIFEERNKGNNAGNVVYKKPIQPILYKKGIDINKQPNQPFQDLPINYNTKQSPVDINSLNPNGPEWLSPKTKFNPEKGSYDLERPEGFYKRGFLPGQENQWIPEKRNGGWLQKYQTGGTLPTPYLKQPSRDDQSAKQLQELGYNDWLQSYHAPAPTYIKKAQDTPQWVRDQYAQQHGMVDWDELQKQAQVTSEMQDPKNKWNVAADFADKVVTAGTIGEMFNPYNYMKAAAKEAPIVQTAEHIPYTGGFPMSTIKKTKGNTPMPFVTEIDPKTVPIYNVGQELDERGYPIISDNVKTNPHELNFKNYRTVTDEYGSQYNIPYEDPNKAKYLEANQKASEQLKTINDKIKNRFNIIKGDRDRLQSEQANAWFNDKPFKPEYYIDEYRGNKVEVPLRDESIPENLISALEGHPDWNAQKYNEILNSSDADIFNKQLKPIQLKGYTRAQKMLGFDNPQMLKDLGITERHEPTFDNGEFGRTYNQPDRALTQADKQKITPSFKVNGDQYEYYINKNKTKSGKIRQIPTYKRNGIPIKKEDYDAGVNQYNKSKSEDLFLKPIKMTDLLNDKFFMNKNKYGGSIPKKQMGGPTVPLTHFQKYIGLNDPTMGNEMYFPGNGQQTTFRGLDNPQVPVAIIDAIGKQKVLKGPKDTDQFVLPVYEKKLPTERGWAKKYGGDIKQQGGEQQQPQQYDWLNQDEQPVALPNTKKRQYKGRTQKKVDRSTYNPHPAINKF